jgi:tetratricopeptide (TPR) repeat protein
MIRVNDSYEEMVSTALALEQQGRADEAILAYEQALEKWPGLPNCWFNLARLYRLKGEFAPALTSYQEALERGVSEPEEVHLNRAVIYSDGLHQYEAAERELKRALELNPRYVPALINLGNLHEDLGRRELAAGVYEQVLALDPGSPIALARYAGLRGFSDRDDPIVARLRHAIAQSGTTVAERSSLEFALGRALDSCGEYDAAFEAYRSANRHSRESAPAGAGEYDLVEAEQFTNRLIAATSAVPPRSWLAQAYPEPIFVCGMFRSGSTLTEQLLAGHPKITAGGELEFFARAIADRLQPYPESLTSLHPEMMAVLVTEYRAVLSQRFPGSTYVTDKRPDNFMHLGLIKTMFPKAKIVHTTRDPLDNCLSIYFLHLDQSKSYALDLMDIGHHYREYLRLMAHWRRLFAEDIIDVPYDELIKGPKPIIEQVLTAVGLNWDERCLTVPAVGRAIKTASAWQVREPLYLRSSGRARHYQKQLKDLKAYLAAPL